MTRERLSLFDTTLRDGQQTHGVQFSTPDKHVIAETLDALGIDYIEGGWPGANPTDNAFFDEKPQTRATFTAFGMTKREGRSAENDDVLAAVLNAGTEAVCLVGKTHDFHVEKALGITLEENRDNIVAQEREALFDAEHFFDGYKANPDYALDCLMAAYENGARWVVLCDTNGGALPAEVGEITSAVIAHGIPGDHLAIHTHDDTGNAVANSLAAIDAGARQIQGTLNGLGERCGNANLVTLIPTLLLKKPYASRFETGVTPENLANLTRASRLLDDILNRVPNKAAPYVGASAFAHKAGLHASAILKDLSTYEHVVPQVVGNERIIPMSNQAGQSNLRSRLTDMGLEVPKGDPALGRILEVVKEREEQGYSFDTAQASFELLARAELGQLPEFFEVKRYKVTVERRKNKYNKMISLSEAVVVVKVGGEKKLSVSESLDEGGSDRGPVNALSNALAKDLGPYQAMIDDVRLVDFKVRITQGGTVAVHVSLTPSILIWTVKGPVKPLMLPGQQKFWNWSRTRAVTILGCGSGGDIDALLEVAPAGQITAVDKYKPFIDAVFARFGHDRRVTAYGGNIAKLKGPYDLIWSAGALYFLGIEKGLKAWRPTLRKTGAVAFSEPCWFTDTPSEAAQLMWSGYPEITDAAGIDARVQAASYETIATRRLADSAWEAYYQPLEARIAHLRPDADDDLALVLNDAEAEIATWRATKDQSGYLLSVVRPR